MNAKPPACQTITRKQINCKTNILKTKPPRAIRTKTTQIYDKKKNIYLVSRLCKKCLLIRFVSNCYVNRTHQFKLKNKIARNGCIYNVINRSYIIYGIATRLVYKDLNYSNVCKLRGFFLNSYTNMYRIIIQDRKFEFEITFFTGFLTIFADVLLRHQIYCIQKNFNRPE